MTIKITLSAQRFLPLGCLGYAACTDSADVTFKTIRLVGVYGNDNEVKNSKPEPILKNQRFAVAKNIIDVASVCKVDNSPYSFQQNDTVPL